MPTERTYRVFKNGEFLHETELTAAKAKKLDGHTQYNPDANDGNGDFEKFRAEEVSA